MRKNHVKLMAVGMLVLAFMTGCASNDNVINELSDSVVSTDMEGAGHNEGEQDSRNDTKPEQSEENKNSRSQPQDAAAAEENNQSQAAAAKENSRTGDAAEAEDTEGIEKELAAYRAEREKGVSSYGNYTMVIGPNEENYKYGVGEIYPVSFDTRELSLAFKAAGAYVEGTLKLKNDVWCCADPRMIAIYEDEDKGVANGYDAENIFLCEYNDNGKWQYLILVREKKGSDWKVLYHGSSYKTDESGGYKD